MVCGELPENFPGGVAPLDRGGRGDQPPANCKRCSYVRQIGPERVVVPQFRRHPSADVEHAGAGGGLRPVDAPVSGGHLVAGILPIDGERLSGFRIQDKERMRPQIDYVSHRIAGRSDDRLLARGDPRAIRTECKMSDAKIVAKLCGIAVLVGLLGIGRDRLRPVEKPHLVAVEIDCHQPRQSSNQNLPQRLVHLDLQRRVLRGLEIRQTVALVKPGPLGGVESPDNRTIRSIEHKEEEPAARRGGDLPAAVDPAGEVDMILRQKLLPEQRSLPRKAEQIVAVAHRAHEDPSARGIDVDGPNPVLAGDRVAQRGSRRGAGRRGDQLGSG